MMRKQVEMLALHGGACVNIDGSTLAANGATFEETPKPNVILYNYSPLLSFDSSCVEDFSFDSFTIIIANGRLISSSGVSKLGQCRSPALLSFSTIISSSSPRFSSHCTKL